MKDWIRKYWWGASLSVVFLAVFIWQMPWIDQHQGSLMVLITVVYVVATVAIFRANNKSVVAANEQLKESKRQFDEEKRLEYAPFLQMERMTIEPPTVDEVFDLKGTGANKKAFFRIKNIGNGTACNIIYFAKSDFFEDDGDCLNCNAIMKGDSITLRIRYSGSASTTGIMTFLWTYNDILDNTYEQKVFIHFKQSSIEKCEVDYPNFQGIVRYSLKKQAGEES